jgi:hypothetical protein
LDLPTEGKLSSLIELGGPCRRQQDYKCEQRSQREKTFSIFHLFLLALSDRLPSRFIPSVLTSFFNNGTPAGV